VDFSTTAKMKDLFLKIAAGVITAAIVGGVVTLSNINARLAVIETKLSLVKIAQSEHEDFYSAVGFSDTPTTTIK
jgi:hypothetical protein